MGSRQAFRLSRRCEDIILGTVLGDGCLERNGTNVRLRIDHSFSQRRLVEWKFRELQELEPFPPRKIKRVDRRTGHMHVNYRFATRTTPVLNEIHSFFYGEGTKWISPEICNRLISSLSLAVWYMDDGGRRGDCRSGYLNTNAYTPEDVEVLKLCLRRNFDIATVTHYAAGKPRIYIPASQFMQFCEIVRPHIIREMEYKLL